MSDTKRRGPSKPKAVIDCTFANAVKIGKHQLLYLSNQTYDMKLQGQVLSIRRHDWENGKETVYTTTANMIYWRE